MAARARTRTSATVRAVATVAAASAATFLAPSSALATEADHSTPETPHVVCWSTIGTPHLSRRTPDTVTVHAEITCNRAVVRQHLTVGLYRDGHLVSEDSIDGLNSDMVWAFTGERPCQDDALYRGVASGWAELQQGGLVLLLPQKSSETVAVC